MKNKKVYQIAYLIPVLAVLLVCQTSTARDERGKLIRPRDDSWLKATTIKDVCERCP